MEFVLDHRPSFGLYILYEVDDGGVWPCMCSFHDL